MVDQFVHGVEVIELSTGPRPIQSARSSVIGLVGTAPDADVNLFPLNEPVLVTSLREADGLIDPEADEWDGNLRYAIQAIWDQGGAVVVVVRVAEGADDAATITNIIGGTNAETGQYTGVRALLGAASATGVTPKILIAPGWSSEVTRSNPEPPALPEITGALVIDALLAVASKLRAVVIADGPNTTDADAIALAELKDSPRLFLIDPWVRVASGDTIIEMPPSMYAAGAMVASDRERGWWASPSNWPLLGIVGTSRAVDFALGVADSRANLLNEGRVTTIINQNGFRLWGNRTPSTDPRWLFLSVRRTADQINESVLQAHLWAVDRGITKTYFEDVVEGVNAYLRFLRTIGAIVGGQCWADPDLNTPAQIALGKAWFDFDFSPSYPAEHVIFRSRLTNDYLEELFE